MAARADPKITLLDYDRLSAAPGAPSGLSGGDWHYQCLFKYRVRSFICCGINLNNR